jgi:hypothetical protein
MNNFLQPPDPEEDQRDEEELILDEVQQLRTQLSECQSKLHKINQWCKAYPLDVFPEPDLAVADIILKAHGMGVSSIGASAMRHVLNGLQDIINTTEGE